MGMNFLILILASFSLFAGSFESQLLDLGQCLDVQKDAVSRHMKLSRVRSREVSDELKAVMDKYEDQYTVTRVLSLLSSTLIQDVCAEDPGRAPTAVGKIKGYRKKSADLSKIDNDLYDVKYIAVNAGFEINDYLYGRAKNQKALKAKLQKATRLFDSDLRKVNALAGKYNQSYKVRSCQKLADKL